LDHSVLISTCVLYNNNNNNNNNNKNNNNIHLLKLIDFPDCENADFAKSQKLSGNSGKH